MFKHYKDNNSDIDKMTIIEEKFIFTAGAKRNLLLLIATGILLLVAGIFYEHGG